MEGFVEFIQLNYNPLYDLECYRFIYISANTIKLQLGDGFNSQPGLSDIQWVSNQQQTI